MHPALKISDSDQRKAEKNTETKRVYQVWKGSNKFFLRGRLVFGPDVRTLFVTIFLIVTPVVMFNVFVCQKFNKFQQHLGDLLVAIASIFTAYIILLLLLISGRDPGIVPRRTCPPEPDNNNNAAIDGTGNRGAVTSLPLTKDVVVNGLMVKVKYCHTCMVYRPPRCSHCSICNNCVELFDHHCPWVGQCIGKRNYRFFFLFVSSTTLLCIYVFAFCWVDIVKIMEDYHFNLWKAFKKSPVSSVLIVYTFIASWFVGGLTIFHLYLISINQTTYENFRYRYDNSRNPYNRGLIHNIEEIFFTKIPRSRNNFRAKVKQESSSPVSSLSLRRVGGQE